MNKPSKAAIVTGGTFGLFAVGFAAIVSNPVVLAAALYGTYTVGKAAYDRNKPGTKLTEEDYPSMREIVPFQWFEETTTSRHGDGISRPRPKARTRDFKLIIFKPGAQPMTWITRAETKRAAIKYAENHWPGAVVEVA